MWSKNKSLLTLDEWARYIEIHPYLVAQIWHPHADLAPSFGQCDAPIFQTAHVGSGILSRDEIVDAIAQAEQMITKMLRTFPAPQYCEHTLLYPREANLERGQLWYGPSGRIKPIQLPQRKTIAVGEYTEELIEAGAAVVESNPQGDAFNTWFTVTVTVDAGTLADEIHCYFVAADRPTVDRVDAEIKPINVSISGTTATITGPLYLLVTLDNYLKLVPEGLDATDAIFATTVDVYRKTVDLSQAGSLIWTNLTSGCDNPPCTHTAYSGCFAMRDPDGGWIVPLPADYSETAEQFSLAYPDEYWAPDLVNVHYIAGYPRENNRMQAQLGRAVAYLATALLPNLIQGCERANQRLLFYRMSAESEEFPVGRVGVAGADRNFGTIARGAVLAYQYLVNAEATNL